MSTEDENTAEETAGQTPWLKERLQKRRDLAKRQGRFSPLMIAALAVALIYGAIAGWLALSEPENTKTPEVIIALGPEPDPPANGKSTSEGEDLSKLLRRAGPDLPPPMPLTEKETEAPEVPKAPAEALIPEEPEPEEVAEEAQEETVQALTKAPIEALTKESKYGPLPVIGADGTRPWQAYARPQEPVSGPVAALVIGGLGISESATANAIEKLPAEVSLAFAPYGRNLQRWIDEARADGHEVLLELPMEPFDYPNNDPGPYTLLTGASAADNLDRLDWLLSRFTGYVGVLPYQGARFTAEKDAMMPIIEALSARGLLYIDAGVGRRSVAGELAAENAMPWASGDRLIDPALRENIIETSLDNLRGDAEKNGTAIGTGSGFPITVEKVMEWTEALEGSGITLVPVSAAVERKMEKTQ
ncbi:divergent polysaccharide deacetylase family protein [Tepidicaulis sp.]|uniref:divergent polysaccharide deacetylase family protein n=1 Tax=Tepidicaulis sp. TaxID=1920809 RepID=UPI003B5947B4